MVGKPVQQGASEPPGGEDLGPFVEGQVAGDQNRGAFIAMAEGLEKQFGAGFGEGHEAQLVDDEQLVGGNCFWKRSRCFSSRPSIPSHSSSRAEGIASSGGG